MSARMSRSARYVDPKTDASGSKQTVIWVEAFFHGVVDVDVGKRAVYIDARSLRDEGRTGVSSTRRAHRIPSLPLYRLTWPASVTPNTRITGTLKNLFLDGFLVVLLASEVRSGEKPEWRESKCSTGVAMVADTFDSRTRIRGGAASGFGGWDEEGALREGIVAEEDRCVPLRGAK